MKTTIKGLATAATFGLLLSACTADDPQKSEVMPFIFSDAAPAVKDFADVSRYNVADTHTGILNAQSDIAFTLLEAIPYDAKANSLVSPVSISTALAMLAEGADGDTKEEILRFISGNDANKSVSIDYYKDLATYLNYTSGDARVVMANSLWVNNGFNVKETYKTSIKNGFSAGVYQADLNGQESVDGINQWVRTYTYGLIDNFLQTPPESQMSLLNTVFVASKWVERFNPDNTTKQPFYLNTGNSVDSDMMSMSGLETYYAEDGDCQICTLYLNGGISMQIIMPKAGSALETMTEKERISSIRSKNNMQQATYLVDLEMPRFKIESDIDLIPSLKSLGITSAFDLDKADFNKIYNRHKDNLVINKTAQKLCLSIDEEGLEGAAVSEITGMTGEDGPRKPEKRVMKVNRPFYYTISSQSPHSILFIGKVNDPTVR